MTLDRQLKELLSPSMTRLEDRLAESYLLASQAETFVRKMREERKSAILSYKNVPLMVQNTINMVGQTDIATTIILFNGSTYDTGAQVKSSGTFVDLEILRSTLRISEKRFKKALEEATQKKNPSLTLQIADRRARLRRIK